MFLPFRSPLCERTQARMGRPGMRAREVNLRLAETFRSGSTAAAAAGHERFVLHADALATAPAELRRAAKRGHADVVGHQ